MRNKNYQINQIKDNKMCETRNMCGRNKICLKFLIGNLNKREYLRIPKRRWEDNIKVGLEHEG
jgi:hypothetical protein